MLLKDNLQKIDWCHLSMNPGAIDILEANLDWVSDKKIDWAALSENPNAIGLLQQNQD